MRISDWSSDVCSSDLRARLAHPGEAAVAAEHPLHVARNLELAGRHAVHGGDAPAQHGDLLQLADAGEALHQRIEVLDLVRLDVDEVEIGRASCRERVCQYV